MKIPENSLSNLMIKLFHGIGCNYDKRHACIWVYISVDQALKVNHFVTKLHPLTNTVENSSFPDKICYVTSYASLQLNIIISLLHVRGRKVWMEYAFECFQYISIYIGRIRSGENVCIRVCCQNINWFQGVYWKNIKTNIWDIPAKRNDE